MRRRAILFAAAIAAFSFFYGSDTGAVNRTHAERFIGAQATGDTGVYAFDKAHSFIGFKVRHNGLIDVPGFFRDFTGTVTYDAKDVSKSSVEFTAKVTSVDTGVAARDNHLRTKDFFEVETHPEITFKSTSVSKKGNTWTVTGNFTMKGVTKEISLPFDLTGFIPGNERSGTRMGITAKTKINRRDFGVNYGGNLPNGTPVIGNDIDIDLQIEALIRRDPPAPRPGF
jgi:polyisoprenoid-binding protein YceI